jgi:hypothetical protein
VIFDRTQNDVNTAISIRENKVQKFIELTDEEVAILEKGLLTINTLNRIEDKSQELQNLINGLGYFNTDVKVRLWAYSDYFKQADFDRILANLQKLRNAFFVYSTTPKNPDNNYRSYVTINAVEKILNDLDVMINDVKSRYNRCGTFKCGEA